MITLPSVNRQFETAKVLLPNGIRLSYVHGGASSGAAVLLLHGITDSSFSFSRVLPLLPSDLRFVALDQRGHGNSDKPARGYTIDDFATDALLVIQALKLTHVTVIGHSMGSFVARRIAERAPDRVSRLVLIGTGFTAQNA